MAPSCSWRFRGNGSWFLLCALLTALKLWLICAQTVHAISPSGLDDELYLFRATAILEGEWLGPLTHLTLSKGPIYPLWLALNHVTGVRLLLSQAVLYFLACIVLARAVRPVVPEAWKRALLYLAILFNPVTWGDGPATRVIREGIYPSLSLMLLALAIGSALRLRESPRVAALWAGGAGLSGALVAMTREDGVWLGPALGVVTVAGVAARWSAGPRRALMPLAVAAAAYVLPTLAVATVNWQAYGVPETAETRAGYFTSAYGSLTRVKTSHWNPYVPVPREARHMLYATSPSLREIAPYLERSAAGWTTLGCAALGVCEDIAGGWFIWAFRSAAQAAGKYQHGAVARTWYEQITEEIDEGCRTGRLQCLPERSTLMPPWKPAYVRPLISAMGEAGVFMTSFTAISPYPGVPQANEVDLARFGRITNEVIPAPMVVMRGILESHVGEVGAAVLSPAGNTATTSMRRAAAPYGNSIRNGVSRTHFTLDTTCVADCRLALVSATGGSIVVPIAETSKMIEGAGITWTTESFDRVFASAEGSPRGSRRLAALAWITKLYHFTAPPLLGLAIAVLLWRVIRLLRARTFPVRSLLALSLLGAAVTRVVLISLVHVTSFPAINVLYLSPAYPMLIAFIALVLIGGPELPVSSQSDPEQQLGVSSPPPATSA